MDKQAVVFKTSPIGGFEKKAVLDYIYRLNEESSTAQTQLREQADSLAAAKASLSDNLRQTNERLIVLQKELDTTRAELSAEYARTRELSARGDSLQDETDDLQRHISQLQQELDSLRRSNEELTSQNLHLASKQAEVDQAVSNVGKILLDARSEADSIIAAARRQAESTVAEAQSEADRLRVEAQTEAESIRQQADDEAQRLRAEAQEEAEATVAEAEVKSAAMQESAQKKCDLLRIETNLAAEEAASSFYNYKHQIGEIQKSVAALLAACSEKTDALEQTIETSGRAFAHTRNAILEAEMNDLTYVQDVELAPAPESAEDSAAGDSDHHFFRAAAES